MNLTFGNALSSSSNKNLITMGTMTLAMLFVYNPTVVRKRFGAIDLHSKTQNRNWFRFFQIDYGLSLQSA